MGSRQEWDRFVNAVTEVVASRGSGYVKQAQFPDPQHDIEAEYRVPVVPGPRGYIDRDGRWFPF